MGKPKAGAFDGFVTQQRFILIAAALSRENWAFSEENPRCSTLLFQFQCNGGISHSRLWKESLKPPGRNPDSGFRILDWISKKEGNRRSPRPRQARTRDNYLFSPRPED